MTYCSLSLFCMYVSTWPRVQYFTFGGMLFDDLSFASPYLLASKLAQSGRVS